MSAALSLADTIPPVTHCGCGLSYSGDAWERLPLLGVQLVPESDAGPAYGVVLRNCSCHSTLGVETDWAPEPYPRDTELEDVAGGPHVEMDDGDPEDEREWQTERERNQRMMWRML